MEPKHPNEDLFRIFLYDYLKKKGFSNTAEKFRNEAKITQQTPSEFDHEPDGFLHDFWILFHDKYTSVDSQDPNVGFQSGQTLLSCDFSSDGNIVASGGLGNKPFICYMESGYSVTTSESHQSTIFEVRFQPGSNKFATCSTDKTVKLWDANTPEKALFNFVGNNMVISLDFNPSEGILCLSDTRDELKVWDLNQQVMISNLKCLELWILENGGPKHSLRASESSITGLAATTAQKFHEYPHGFLHEFWLLLHDDMYNPMLQKKPPPSNQALNVGTSRDTTPQIYQEGYSIKFLAILFDLAGHNGVVKSLDFHPIETLLCSSDSFDVIEVWDLINCVRMKNFMAGGQQIRFQPVFGKFLAVANRNVITILDIQTWKVQNRFQVRTWNCGFLRQGKSILFLHILMQQLLD
ncbi:hypothetical protein TSUD_64320 [Trifolium subterraneum]|uniref:LisH domain-containing protein n=1 Tax=Trifolium subterraneum TaxID=3900 RepID=A0A2Z6MIS7_TRISU|nr:hypothetical protein TSUD_64320 [Trifolium subterraneum]